MSGVLGVIGRKHVEIAQRWMGSAATFGAAAGCGLLYFTDWRVFVTWIPFYNTKFEGESTDS